MNLNRNLNQRTKLSQAVGLAINAQSNTRSKVLGLMIGASLISCGPVFAQQNDNAQSNADTLEELVVTGYAQSLIRSQDIKRNESGVVDAISAEDIGKFADANLAESLQRITGVSIDRASGEGSQVTVRGLGPNFNLVTLNGRQMPTANSPEQESIASATQSRAFNFNQISSEGVSGVSVYKTARADLPSGGLGATIDILTARPFDYDGTTFVGVVKTIHDSSAEEGSSLTPEVSALYSTMFADDTVGLLANFSYSQRNFSESSVHTDGWLRDNIGSGPYDEYCRSIDCSGIPFVYRPVTNIGEIQHNERERINAGLVAQFRPNDNVDITLDYVLSRFENEQDRFQTGLFGVVAPGTVSGVTLSPNNSLLSVTRANSAADAIFYRNRLEVENDSVGLNIKWNVNDKLQLDFDAHSSKAESQPGGELADVTQIAQGPLGNTFGIRYRPKGIDIGINDSGAFRGDQAFGGGNPLPGVNNFLSPAGFSPLGTVLRNIAIENTVDQVQLGATWDFDTYKVTSGLSYTDYQVDTNAVFTGFQFQGLGTCPTCPSFILEPSSSGAPSGFQLVNQITDIDEFVLAAYPTQNDVYLSNNPPTFFGASEESLAFHINLNKEFELSGKPAKINAGLRYENTDVTGSAFQTFPTALQIDGNTEGTVLFSQGAQPEFFVVEEDYSVLLPAIDFEVEFAEDHVARFSYGRSIARPDLNGLRPITTISDYRPGVSTASSGNPGLEPYLSDNFDFSYEWYYNDSSFFSAALFHKKVDDYIGTGVETDVILDVNGNPLLNPEGRYVPVGVLEVPVPVVSQSGDPVANFDITRLTNSSEQDITGLELNIQHLFGDTGFGVQANLTLVDSDAEFDTNEFGEQSILIGLSDSANLVGFYETDKYSVRLAANYRDEFLFALGQLRATNEPVYTEEYLQWDLSASYSISDTLTLSFEVLNALGEDIRQRGRYKEQFLYENTQDPRFALGLRAKF